MKYRSVLSHVRPTASLTVPTPAPSGSKHLQNQKSVPPLATPLGSLVWNRNKRSGPVSGHRSCCAAVGRRDAGRRSSTPHRVGLRELRAAEHRDGIKTEVDIKSEMPILSGELWLKEGVTYCN